MWEELAAMTRWSLGRRQGTAQDGDGKDRPDTVVPGTERQAAAPLQAGQPAGEASARRPAAGPRNETWFKFGADQSGGRQAGNGVAVLAPDEGGQPAGGGAWPDICDQFGLHLLVLTEQLRNSLDELEADEGDPERLRRLYQVDHAVTRMRRASRDLRILAGRSEEELAGFTTTLLDVIRMGASAIERYPQVTIGRVVDLAVLGYAADDVGSVMAALLDNATRYSPGPVSVSSHLLEDGGVMFRIEDSGIGMAEEQVAELNAALAGPVAAVDERTGRHTGFPVVHRIAGKHSLGVRLATRPAPSSGTIVMVTIPPHLLCEVPADRNQRRRPASASPAAAQPNPVPDPSPDEQARAQQPPRWAPPEVPDCAPAHDPDRAAERAAVELPRRQRASLRGGKPRPKPQPRGMVPTAEQQAAARRAFADDLTAFSLGASGPAEGDPVVISGAEPAGGSPAAGDGADAVTSAMEGEPQP